MDPLTAVVLLAIVGAGAAVALLQIDDGANEAVDVAQAVFEAGDFPAVCCKTGVSAEVGVTVLERRWFRTVSEGIVPITRSQHIRFFGWRDLNRRATVAFPVVGIVGIALRVAADSVVVDWAVDLSILAVLFLAVFTKLAAKRTLAVPRRRTEAVVSLRAVHPEFANALRRADP